MARLPMTCNSFSEVQRRRLLPHVAVPVDVDVDVWAQAQVSTGAEKEEWIRVVHFEKSCNFDLISVYITLLFGD